MLLSPSCFGPVGQSPLSLHCFSHLLSPSCFWTVRQYPQYLLDCQCHSLLLISCPIPAVKLFCLFHHICCRPYHVECTGSLPTSEVKRHRARLVLGWGAAWEDLRVLTAIYNARVIKLPWWFSSGGWGCNMDSQRVSGLPAAWGRENGHTASWRLLGAERTVAALWADEAVTLRPPRTPRKKKRPA